MHEYVAYGLSVGSDFPLLLLQPSRAAACDVHIHRHSVGEATEQPTWLITEPSPSQYLWRTPLGIFTINDGQEIIAAVHDQIDIPFFHNLLANRSMGLLSHQRERLVLHGSAASFRGRAIIFLGSSGEGKSTLAYALSACGGFAVADDISVIESKNGQICLQPAFPYLKLAQSTISFFDVAPARLIPIESLADECLVNCTDSWQPAPLPVGLIYCLQRGAVLGSEPLQTQQAFISTVGATSFPLLVTTPQQKALHFKQCTEVASSVPIRRLTVPLDFVSLSSLPALIDRDLEASARSVGDSLP